MGTRVADVETANANPDIAEDLQKGQCDYLGKWWAEGTQF